MMLAMTKCVYCVDSFPTKKTLVYRRAYRQYISIYRIMMRIASQDSCQYTPL